MAFYSNKNSVDIEMGSGQLYPGMMENPQLRWGFIRKVYSILCLQLLVTFATALAMTLIQPVRDLLRTTTGLYLMLLAILLTVTLCLMMSFLSQKHPWNYLLLFLFTFAMAFMVGACSSQRKGETVILAAGLTLLVTVGLTVFTFVAAKRGADFSFLGPFLFCALLLLMAFGIIRIIFPLGKIGQQLIGCAGALVFSGFIIYDTDNMIKRFTYDQYIEAACCLFMDIVNLFLYILQIVDD